MAGLEEELRRQGCNLVPTPDDVIDPDVHTVRASAVPATVAIGPNTGAPPGRLTGATISRNAVPCRPRTGVAVFAALSFLAGIPLF